MKPNSRVGDFTCATWFRACCAVDMLKTDNQMEGLMWC